MKVTAQVQRSGGWWAIEVPEVPGVFTQAKRLDQVEVVVQDAVSTMLDGEVAPGDVEVVLAPVLGEESETVVQAAREASAAAQAASARSSEAMRAAVAHLRRELTVRDAAAVLGVSHQRVAQLEKSSMGTAR